MRPAAPFAAPFAAPYPARSAVVALAALALPWTAACAAGQEATPSQSEWVTLFDGTSLERWRGYRQTDVPAAWRIEDGTLAFVPGTGDGGDLVTRGMWSDFELTLEWRVEPGGNSGVFYRATEATTFIYENASEMQVLDDARHPDGRSPLTSAGANFGLYAAIEGAVRPAGEWNRARIVARGAVVQHWLNGTLVVEYEQGGEEWRRRVADSKFADWPEYGRAMTGRIGLQDHGNRVWFRDIRIRAIR